MITVLLTGFEPFDGAADNPSRRAVLTLAAEPHPPGTRIATAILPVSYARAGTALREAVLLHRPDVLIATGLAGGRAEMSVERVAINVDDAALADNEGALRIDAPVVEGGPAAYFAALPIKAIAAAIRAAGVPATVSQTAGTFLCNHIFYRACHLAATEQPGMRAGFIHMPWLPEQAAAHPGEPSMALASIVTALRAAIVAARDTTEDLAVAAGAVS
jgi:pyroglutamyl-peptidase